MGCHPLLQGIVQPTIEPGSLEALALQVDSLLLSQGGTPMCCLLLLSRFSRVQLFATPRIVAHQALLSMGFSRQEYWSGVPFPSP